MQADLFVEQVAAANEETDVAVAGQQTVLHGEGEQRVTVGGGFVGGQLVLIGHFNPVEIHQPVFALEIGADADAFRCQTRQIAAGAQFAVGAVIEAAQIPVAAECGKQRQACRQFDAVEFGIGLCVGVHRQFVDRFAGRCRVNVVIDTVAIQRQVEAGAFVLVAQAPVDIVGAFAAQIGVALFVALRGEVRAVGEQFFGGWHAFGLGQ